MVFLDLRQPHLRASLEWFVETVLRPRADEFAKFTFTVMGRVEPDSGLLDLCRELPIRFVSWVNDYKVMLKSANVVITPDRAGTGLKNRVIQSMGLGCAVIGTSVAFEGIAASNYVNAVIADDPGAMSDALLRLMVDDDARERMGTKAMTFAMQEFHPGKVQARWHALQDEIRAHRE
ncbi:Glycosyl transferases group 1 [Sphingomonas sp. NFR15]|nr:Glycosyl transferases group 1 [Sphingomonas sp. NFR15]